MSDKTKQDLQKFRDLLEEGCHQGCDYDEAEGDLIDHCDACCRKITVLAYELLVIRMEWPELRELSD